MFYVQAAIAGLLGYLSIRMMLSASFTRGFINSRWNHRARGLSKMLGEERAIWLHRFVFAPIMLISGGAILFGTTLGMGK